MLANVAFRIDLPHGRCVGVRIPTGVEQDNLLSLAPGLASLAEEERDYLDLRDWLRVSSEDRALYAGVKRHLAQKQWSDMNDYADAKTDVVSPYPAIEKGFALPLDGPGLGIAFDEALAESRPFKTPALQPRLNAPDGSVRDF